MGRDTWELARDSLFIEKIRNAFQAADADLLDRVCLSLQEREFDLGSKPFRAAELLIDPDADAITVAGALLAPLLWQGRAEPGEIHRRFGLAIDATLKDLSSPFILRTHTKHHFITKEAEK